MGDRQNTKIDEFEALANRYLEQGAYDDVFFVYDRLASLDPSDVKKREVAVAARTVAIMADEIKRKDLLQPGDIEARLRTLAEIERAWPSIAAPERFAEIVRSYKKTLLTATVPQPAVQPSSDYPAAPQQDGSSSPVAIPIAEQPKRVSIIRQQDSQATYLSSLVEQILHLVQSNSVFSFLPFICGCAIFLLIGASVLDKAYGRGWQDTGGFSFQAAYHQVTPLQVEPEGSLVLMRPPLYTWLLSIPIRLFGFSDIVLRATNIVMGTGAIVAFFILFRKRSSDFAAGLAIVFVSFSPVMIVNFVDIVNYDNLLPVLYGVALLFALDESSSRRSGLLSIVALGLASFTKVHAIILIPFLLWAFWRRERNLLPRLAWCGAVILVPLAVYTGWEYVAAANQTVGPFSYNLGISPFGNYGGGGTKLSGRHIPEIYFSPEYWQVTKDSLVLWFPVPLLALAGVGLALRARTYPFWGAWLLGNSLFTIAIGEGYSYGLFLPAAFAVGFFAAQSVDWTLKEIFSRYRSRGQPAAQSTPSLRRKRVMTFARITIAFIAAGAIAYLIPTYVVSAADSLRNDILAPARHSEIIKKAAFALAPKLSEKEPIVYGWAAQDLFMLGMYLAEAGTLHPRPFINIRNLSDADLSQDNLMKRGVRYIAVSDLWARDNPPISELLLKKFRLEASFQDDWGTSSVFDVTQPSNFIMTTLWEERAESASGWRSTSSPLQIAVDSVEHAEGTASLKLSPGQLATTQNQWWAAELKLDAPKDWSNASSLSFEFKSDVPKQVLEVASVDLRSADGKTYAQYFFTFEQGPWQRITINPQRPTYRRQLDFTQIGSVTVAFSMRDARPFTVWVDDLKVEGFKRIAE